MRFHAPVHFHGSPVTRLTPRSQMSVAVLLLSASIAPFSPGQVAPVHKHPAPPGHFLPVHSEITCEVSVDDLPPRPVAAGVPSRFSVGTGDHLVRCSTSKGFYREVIATITGEMEQKIVTFKLADSVPVAHLPPEPAKAAPEPARTPPEPVRAKVDQQDLPPKPIPSKFPGTWMKTITSRETESGVRKVSQGTRKEDVAVRYTHDRVLRLNPPQDNGALSGSYVAHLRIDLIPAQTDDDKVVQGMPVCFYRDGECGSAYNGPTLHYTVSGVPGPNADGTFDLVMHYEKCSGYCDKVEIPSDIHASIHMEGDNTLILTFGQTIVRFPRS